MLSDESQDSQDYYESECARITNFQEALNQFITRASAENYVREVRPEDSISNVGSRMRTRSLVLYALSRKSGSGTLAHVHGPRLAAAAKRAALQADAATLHKQQPIQQEELHLRQEVIKQQQLQEEAKLRLAQRKRQLDLERKIARVQAEEHTHANAELETASIKQPSEIPTRVLPLPLDQQPFCPKKPRPPMAPQETKPFENKYYEDVRLASHLEDSIKGSPSSRRSSTGERFLQELIDIQREQQRHNKKNRGIINCRNYLLSKTSFPCHLHYQAARCKCLTEIQSITTTSCSRLRISLRQRPLTARCAYTNLCSTLAQMSTI